MLCVFSYSDCGFWVASKHERALKKYVVEHGRAPTENSSAPCVVRKAGSITKVRAVELLNALHVESVTIMQYGQKAPFDNTVVQWALNNVRGIERRTIAEGVRPRFTQQVGM